MHPDEVENEAVHNGDDDQRNEIGECKLHRLIGVVDVDAPADVAEPGNSNVGKVLSEALKHSAIPIIHWVEIGHRQ